VRLHLPATGVCSTGLAAAEDAERGADRGTDRGTGRGFATGTVHGRSAEVEPVPVR
jgi:hypothetical protein